MDEGRTKACTGKKEAIQSKVQSRKDRMVSLQEELLSSFILTNEPSLGNCSLHKADGLRNERENDCLFSLLFLSHTHTFFLPLSLSRAHLCLVVMPTNLVDLTHCSLSSLKCFKVR